MEENNVSLFDDIQTEPDMDVATTDDSEFMFLDDDPSDDVIQETHDNTMSDLEDHINPVYYNKQTSLECIDSMIIAFGKEAVMNYCVLCAYKYVWRCENKANFKEDVSKAQWYLAKTQELSEVVDDSLTAYDITRQAKDIRYILDQMIERYEVENGEL